MLRLPLLLGRSGKRTSAIVIEANMCASQRRNCFSHETGWRKTQYAGVSIVLVTHQKNFAHKSKSADEENMLVSIESADYNNLLTESADKNKIP